MRDDRLYLIHIREAIERIEEYTRAGEIGFREDHKTQDAVLRNLHTLSESTQRLSQVIKDQNPNVDWRSIAAFRNIIVHDYLGVDIDQIWDIVQDDLPGLKHAVVMLLAK